MSIINFKFVEFFAQIGKNKVMKNLREYRKKNGIMQKDLASQLGVAVSTFSGWESGTYEIDNKNLIKLSEILNVSVGFLLDVEKEPGIFDDARVAKPRVQELFDQLTVVDQGRILGKMELMIEEYSSKNTGVFNANTNRKNFY